MPELTQVGPYRIEALLGEGANGTVYRARGEDGSLVALKLLDRAGAADERFRRRFLRESEAAAHIAHPNVVRTLAAGEADGRLWLALELIDGTDLRTKLRAEGRLGPEQAVDLVEQVASALDAAHADGLVHRDVKPGNILIVGERALVCDFGLARHVSSVSSLTGDRGFVGTIDYVSPEQIEGGEVDGRADVYSLGCVLYECLTGARPFERESELSVVFAHLNEPPPKLTDARPDLPAAFDELFATALAKSPNDRYPTCGELAVAARAASHGEVVARHRSRRRLLVGAAALLLAAAAAVAIALTTGGSGMRATISPTSIGGAKLGDSSGLVRRLWGGGRTFLTQTPGNYVVVTRSSRNLGAYFVGTTDRAVELTTWNKADRTAEGIGPCSTLADLRRVYGKRLKASPHNRNGNVVFGWTVGKHLFFGMGPFEHPTQVQAVAIHSNPLGNAGYIALNDGPCSPAADSSPITRPAAIPQSAEPALPERLVSRSFRPRLTIAVPEGWRRVSDTAGEYRIVSPSGTSVDFRLDPLASSSAGSPLANVSTTPTSLAAWLQRNRAVAVTAPQALYTGRQVFQTLFLGVTASKRVPYLVFAHGSPLTATPGHRARVYLTPVRLRSLTHTLAIAVDSPSAKAFDNAVPIVSAVMKHLAAAAAPARILSALSSLCTEPYFGTCRGELPAGVSSTRTLRPKLTYAVPLGWTNFVDHVGVFGLIPPGGDFTSVDRGASDYIDVFTSIATGNGRCADGHGAARTPEAMLAWFRRQPGIAAAPPRRATVGGLSGYVVDLRMPVGFKATCPWSHGFPAQQAITGLPPSPDEMNHALYPGHAVMRLYLLHHKGGTLGIEIQDVRDDARLAVYDKVVHSFRFARG